MSKYSTRDLISKHQRISILKNDNIHKSLLIEESKNIVNQKLTLGDVPYLTDTVRVAFFDSKVSFFQDSIKSDNKVTPLRFEDDIETFSYKSRLRMLKLLSSVNYRNYSSIFFVTTTFHNIAPENAKSLKTFLDTYIKRVKRLDSSLDYIWRLEFQKRGTPHFHFLFLSKVKYEKKALENIEQNFKRKWHTLLEDLNLYSFLHSVKVDYVKDKQKILSYISKYTAKADKFQDKFKFGRRWSYSNSIDVTPVKTAVLDKDLIDLFRKKILEHIKKFSKISSEFEALILSNYSCDIILSYDEQIEILQSCFDELQISNTT